MAVVLDVAATNVNTTNNTVLSVPLTVGILTNPCISFWTSWISGGAVTVSSVRLDASALLPFTRFNGVTKTMDGAPAGGDQWSLVGLVITPGAHTIDVTMSGNTQAKFGCAASFSGVDQTTPLASFTSDTTDTTSPVAITPAGGTADDLMAAVMMNADGIGTQTPAVGANTTILGTVRKEATVEGTVFIGGYGAGNAASIGFSWTTIVDQITFGSLIKSAGGTPPSAIIRPRSQAWIF